MSAIAQQKIEEEFLVKEFISANRKGYRYTKDFVKKVMNPFTSFPVPFNLSDYKVSEYVLPEEMSDKRIDFEADASLPMAESFWLLFRILLIQPELGVAHFNFKLQRKKKYIAHIMVPKGALYVVSLEWESLHWNCDAFEAETRLHDKGTVFISLEWKF